MEGGPPKAGEPQGGAPRRMRACYEWFKPLKRLALLGEGEPPKVGEPQGGAPRFCAILWLYKWLEERLVPKKISILCNIFIYI